MTTVLNIDAGVNEMMVLEALKQADAAIVYAYGETSLKP